MLRVHCQSREVSLAVSVYVLPVRNLMLLIRSNTFPVIFSDVGCSSFSVMLVLVLERKIISLIPKVICLITQESRMNGSDSCSCVHFILVSPCVFLLSTGGHAGRVTVQLEDCICSVLTLHTQSCLQGWAVYVSLSVACYWISQIVFFSVTNHCILFVCFATAPNTALTGRLRVHLGIARYANSLTHSCCTVLLFTHFAGGVVVVLLVSPTLYTLTL